MPKEPESTRGVLKNVGFRIRELRRARGLTQEDAADRLRMLAPNYARVEQGRQNVTVDTLVRIARALDVGVVELFKAPKSKEVRPGRPREKRAPRRSR